MRPADPMTIRTAYLTLFLASVAIIAGAWIFQMAGYAPCHLCLLQRWPWYGAIVLSGLCAAFLPRQRAPLLLFVLLFTGSALFGGWHAGIEWKIFAGPTSCTGTLSGAMGLPDLTNAPVVTCGEAAIRILGLSLAGWNAVVSAALALFALIAFRRAR